MNKSFLCISAILLICLSVVASIPNTPISKVSDAEAEKLFIQFIHKFERYYGAENYKKRFEVFKMNLDKVNNLNYLHKDTTYGVTKFMDLTEEEFNNLYLSKQPMHQLKESFKDFEVVKEYKVPNDLPEEYEWVSKGAVTSVKNQGSCGSCWAFSATGNIEGQHFLKTQKLVSLSEQNLVDCDHLCDPEDPKSCDSGCNGGLMMTAFTFIAQQGGIDTEESYRYEGVDGKCRFNNATIGAKVSGGKMLPEDEDQLAAWLLQNGPIAVALNAEWLQFYTGGVSDPMFCSPTALNHGVLIVGYGKQKAGISGEIKPYWLVKNSWGTGWGSKGYFKMRRGKGTCGINTYACTAVIDA